ncbi:MAG: hypothetical protein ACRCXB_23000 [Aeromonadaceae bacterium]
MDDLELMMQERARLQAAISQGLEGFVVRFGVGLYLKQSSHHQLNPCPVFADEFPSMFEAKQAADKRASKGDRWNEFKIVTKLWATSERLRDVCEVIEYLEAEAA